jgi:hypothetical protein
MRTICLSASSSGRAGYLTMAVWRLIEQRAGAPVDLIEFAGALESIL